MISYPYKTRTRVDDVALLLPSFQPVVLGIVARLQELGFQPVVFDTLRTQEEADANAARGVGSKGSMHLYGAACDCVCNVHLWSCSAKGCKFFTALRRLALASAYIGPESDMPHFQAIPVKEQVMFRALPKSERDAFAAKWLAAKRA